MQRPLLTPSYASIGQHRVALSLQGRQCSPVALVRCSNMSEALTPHAVQLGNETVKVLYQPSSSQLPCDIVFFHGLQLGKYETAWEHTWTNGQGVLWPKTWLGEDFPSARIMSVSYNSQAIKGNMSMDSIGKRLVDQVCWQMDVGKDKPVILVGHSLGGLVLKQLCLQAKKEANVAGSMYQSCCNAFCHNLAGAFFYATPNGGSKLAGLAQSAFGLFSVDGPVLQYLTVLSEDAAELNRAFWTTFPELRTMAVIETKKYKGVMVVEKAAAIQYINNPIEVDEDHISICKPSSKNAATYQHLKKYIAAMLADVKPGLAEGATVSPQLKKELESEFNKVQEAMSWFREKKATFEGQLGAERWAEGLFLPPASEDDIKQTESNRRELQTFWRYVQSLYKDSKITDTLFDGIWGRRAREYRLLLEPVDIANFYRCSFHTTGSGHYIDGIENELQDDNRNRPGRYLLLQQVEQRIHSKRDPSYVAQSSLGLARLLKERLGTKTWQEYASQLQAEPSN